MTTETWLPVIGYESYYEVSDLGRVRSLRRGIIMKPSYSNTGGYPLLILSGSDGHPRGRYVHRLVLEAFAGLAPEGTECRHLDGDPRNCALGNLAWGTSNQNKHDQVRHGTHPEASRTACHNGHEYTDESSYWNGRQRVCRPCNNARVKAWNERNAQSGRHCSVDGCDKASIAKGLCRRHYDLSRK